MAIIATYSKQNFKCVRDKDKVESLEKKDTETLVYPMYL